MEIIFLLGAVQAFFFALLLFIKKNRNKADNVLFFILVCFGLLLTDNYLRNNGFYEHYPQYFGITYCIPMITGPSLLLYVYVMTTQKPNFKWYDVMHLLPFVIFIIYFLITFYFLSGTEKQAFLDREAKNTSFMIYASESVLIFSTPVYNVIALFLLRRHSQKIKDRFSYSEKIDLDWLKFILVSTLMVCVILLITNLVSDILHIIEPQDGDNLIFVGVTVFVFLIGIYGNRQRAVYSDITTGISKQKLENNTTQHLKTTSEENQKVKYERSSLKPEKAEGLLKELLEYMEKEKPYLNGKLTQKQVADTLLISTNHLSQIINEKLNKNFFDFINAYRVEHVKLLLSQKDFKNYTLLAIAYESGFNSKSAFNSIFKKQTGITPSQYQKSPDL